MNIKIQAIILLVALTAVFSTDRAIAQILTDLNSFTNGSDGANPQGGLNLSDGTLFGTASSGGTNISGTTFTFSTGGARFGMLGAFILNSTNLAVADYTNSYVGTDPQAILALSGNTLYGTAYDGGTNNAPTGATNANGALLQLAPTINGTSAPVPGATSSNAVPATNAVQFHQLLDSGP